MLIIIAVSVILLLPVISYLFQPFSNQKSFVFLATFIICGGFLLNFLSPNALIGSWVQTTQSESIYRTIVRNEDFDNFIINEYLDNISSEDESFMLGAQVFYKALELGSFNSAESILKTLNTQFISL